MVADNIVVSELSRMGIRGYCDQPSAAPGETLQFYVSADAVSSVRADLVKLVHGDTNPAGPGFKEVVVSNAINGDLQVSRQRTQIGSYIEVPDADGDLYSGSFSAHMFVRPSLFLDRRQTLISRWADDEKSGWVLYIQSGYLHFMIGDGKSDPVVLKAVKPLLTNLWFSVSASYDHEAASMHISQRSVVNCANSQYGVVADLDFDCIASAPCPHAPAPGGSSMYLGALAESKAAGQRIWLTATFNGKIDSPTLIDHAATASEIDRLSHGDRSVPGVLGAWDFAEGIGRRGIGTDKVVDRSGNGFHGHCVNQPERACTGWNWDGSEDNFILAPEFYGAIAFHEDALDDCRWQPSLAFSIPDDLKSGCYALRLVGGGSVEHVPFFVLPPRARATADILLLIPTCTYLAYANWQPVASTKKRQGAAGRAYVLNDFDVEVNLHADDYGLSAYEAYADSRSVKYSTWRRPISNMRPMSRHREFGGPWGFSADLHLVDWLEKKNFDFDVATDHDLIREGADLFRRYKTVLTGSHPEYYSNEMIQAWEQYLAEGGHGMYLGANGMYWVVSNHPQKPWLMEVRKGESGATAIHSTSGEFYHSTTGERGGLWRHRGRAPQKIWGTGFGSFGFDTSTHYVQLPDASDLEVSWIMEGIGKGELIGDFGLVGNGASGMELDVYDPSLGTPPNTYLLASSTDHSRNYVLATEVGSVLRPGMNGQEHPEVRADIIYFTSKKGGAVFSPSSIAWCASLSWNNYDNNVSRMTENVLRRFSR